MRAVPVHRQLLPALVLALALLGAACGGDDADDVVATEPAAPVDAATADEASTPPATAAEDVAPADDAAGTPTATADAAPAGDGIGAGIEGCPPQTELGVVLRRTDGEEVILEPTVFPAGHMVLDLDGSGFGPILAGTLTTDPSADATALGEDWSSPDTPPEGQYHLTIQLQGPAAGETTYPLGVYDQTEADGVVAPTEGMGLGGLSLVGPDGSTRTMAKDNQVELTHIGDGVVCGAISSAGREPGSSNPRQEVTGSFAATLAEQP